MASSLSRIGWFSFAGVKVTNLDFNLNTPKLVDVNKPASPKMDYWEFSAPKKHGSSYGANRYEDIDIKVVIGVNGTAEERQAKITNILQQWIGKEGQLIFADRPNCFYKARFFNACTTKDNGTFTEVTITFIASYCLYGLYGDMRDYLVADLTMTCDDIGCLVNKALWESITGYTSKQVENKGNFETKPTIILDGTANLLIMQIGNEVFSISNVDTVTYIDCDAMTVYKIENNKKVSLLPQFQGVFPTISPGIIDVIISGTNLSLDVIVEYRDTYIV